MNGRPSLERMNAFVDGELDLAAQLEMEQQVAGDPELRVQADSLRALRRTLRDQAQYHRAPDALRERLRSLAGRAAAPAPARRPPGRAERAREVLQRWFDWRPLVSSFGVAALAFVVLQSTVLQTSRDERVGDEIVASHVRATLAQRLVDVESSDHHTVKPWLSSKLDFSPPVPELKGTPEAFVGGRVDYVDGRPVAVLVYRHGNHVVDSYVWPTQAADAPVTTSSERGFQLARWRRDGMAHWVVSDVGPQEFQALVRELSTPEPNAAR